MSKITISIADHPQSRAQKSLRSRKRVFDLGLAYTAELMNIRDVEAIRG